MRLSVRMKIGTATIPILDRSIIPLLNDELKFKPQDETLKSQL